MTSPYTCIALFLEASQNPNLSGHSVHYQKNQKLSQRPSTSSQQSSPVLSMHVGPEHPAFRTPTPTAVTAYSTQSLSLHTYSAAHGALIALPKSVVSLEKKTFFSLHC